MIIKNKYGFFEVSKKPSSQELEKYYKEKYYQTNKGSYEKKYLEEEIKYFNNKLEEKYFVLTKKLALSDTVSFLDIGAGEGWAMSFFKEKGWNVIGLDYSKFGCENHNAHCCEDLIVGDIYQSFQSLISQNKKFDVILLDNVLEHVIDPKSLLENCKKLANENSILIVEVPNDFSTLQHYLFENKKIDNKFWVALPDHLSYFNKDGLNKLCADAGWNNVLTIADYPIDLHLLNENTNYTKDKTKGKSCHLSRILTDNIFHSISTEKTVALYIALADLGMGRQITGFYKLQTHHK